MKQISIKNNKALKAIGILLMLASFLFIGRNIYNSWDSLVTSINKNSVLLSIALMVMVAAALWLFAVLYKSLLCAMTGAQIDQNCISLYIRSTLYKYLPGNVMHYVGRNALIKEGEVSFAQVNAASVFEVLVNLIAAFLVAISFSGRLVFAFLRDHLNHGWLWIIIAVVIVIVLISLLLFRKKLITLFHQMLNNRVIKILFLMLLVYAAWNILGNSMVFLILMSFVPHMSSSAYRMFIGAGTGAWFIGFITPGAPGGIGIREAALNFLISGVAPMWAVSACGIVSRIAQILGEVLANITLVICKMFKRRLSDRRMEEEGSDE